jgi:hypothetical protein
MPAQKRVGTDEQRAPALARKQTACGGKEGSIRRAQLGSTCLATKNLELVAENAGPRRCRIALLARS